MILSRWTQLSGVGLHVHLQPTGRSTEDWVVQGAPGPGRIHLCTTLSFVLHQDRLCLFSCSGRIPSRAELCKAIGNLGPELEYTHFNSSLLAKENHETRPDLRKETPCLFGRSSCKVLLEKMCIQGVKI